MAQALTIEQRNKVHDVLAKNMRRISELDHAPRPKETDFRVSTFDDTLRPLVNKASVIIVAGAFFGDEGKGKTVDAILRSGDVKIVARVNSGANAGHTVVDNGRKYVFHLAPSGMLVPGVQNYIGPECVMDPIDFVKTEMQPLREANINTALAVGNVHIVAPYHKLIDMLTSSPNSSTLQGMSPVHASKITKKGIRLNDLFSTDSLAARLHEDLKLYEALVGYHGFTKEKILERCEQENGAGVKRIPDYVIEFSQTPNKVDYLVDLYRREVVENVNFPARADVNSRLRSSVESGYRVLLEGPQAYWLSNGVENHWRSSTSAAVHASGILSASGISPNQNVLVLNVHKVPSSRVGKGANPAGYVPQDFFSELKVRRIEQLDDVCTDFDEIQRQYFRSIKENGILSPTIYCDVKTGSVRSIAEAMAIASAREHNEVGATTKRPRVTGLFDCVAQYVVNQAQGPYLSISGVDRYDSYDRIGVIIAYVYHHPEGKTIDSNGLKYKDGDVIKPGDPYPTEDALEHCYPIIKTMKGWKDTPIAANAMLRKSQDELPYGVKDLLATIEHFTGSKVISIGNGPNAEDLIYIARGA